MIFKHRPSSTEDSTSRGQSEVLGFVLLIGLTMAVIGATVAVGSVAYSSATADAEYASVENAMSKLSSQASLVALGSHESRSFDLGSMRDGSVHVDESQGSIQMYYDENATSIANATLDERTRFYDESLGAVVYRDGERELAMQGGGVWKLENGVGSMVSPPEYHYRQTTLTFPIVRVTGEGSTSGRVGGSVEKVSADRITNPNAPSNPIDNGTVVITVQSDYYQGWYNFFQTRSGGSVSIDHENQTTTVDLQYPQELSFKSETGLLLPFDAEIDGDSGQGNDWRDNVDGFDQTALPSMEPIVSSQIESARNNEDTIDLTEADLSEGLEAGVYYADDDFTISDEVTINTDDGNVTIVVDGDLTIDSPITVTGNSENGVRYYVNGSLQGGNQDITTDNESPESQRNVFFVGGDAFTDTSGTLGTIHAYLIATDGTVAFGQGGGNTEFIGGVAANEFNPGQSAQWNLRAPADQSDDFVIDLGVNPNTITYLHPSENTVRIEL
ncbi:DUF7289 family protein [Natronocalculus amylovorans]|uniref:DUF7305 domain-containing protein n=1 Tax=Natronocalculus amylovorans TaxID=2917812 RepID=A0AAE3KDP1_9EURY|nr:hypothetical protein [Natronocalculus amylovorans]MCL9818399.1 hypothetical protein [Natronocalculus amylovorans]